MRHVHWIVRQNRRQRTFFYPVLALIFGVQLHDVGAPFWAWPLLLTHFFIYPQWVYAHARRQPDAECQRRVELRYMEFDNFLYALWFVGLDFALWPCFILLLAAAMSMVAYHGMSGLARLLIGLLPGLLAGAAVFWPLRPQPETSAAVTALSMLGLAIFLMMYARDAYQRSRSLYDSRQRMHRQLDEIRVLQAQLREVALRDPLTGLHNRRHLSEALPGALARCARRKQPLTLVMIDIDHFKHVNDTCGHAAGDAMLIALARLLQGHVRRGDTVCRMGGEEFLLVLENAALERAWARMQALRVAFADLVVMHETLALHATISCGLAALPEHGRDAPSLIEAADRALYAAKAAGRNQLQAAPSCG